MLFEILSQSGNHILFCFCFHKTVLQGEERRGLHCVQYRHLEIARPVEELLFQICLRGFSHRRILRLIVPCRLGHITHHRGIDCPITCAQIVPILFDILSQDRDTEGVLLIKFTVAFKRLITEPVSPLIIAVFRSEGPVVVFALIHVTEVFIHRLPVFVNDGFVSKLLPDDPRNDDSGICPTHSHHVGRECSVLCKRSHSRVCSCLRLGVAQVTCPFMEKGVRVGEECAGLGKNLGISRPSETFVSLRTVCRYGKIVGTLSP